MQSKWKINWIYTDVLFKDRKETLAFLVKILNDNFEVKAREKIVNFFYIHITLNGQSQYWDQNLMKRSTTTKSNIEFCKYYLYIADNASMYILMNLIFIQRILLFKDGYLQVRSFMKNRENLETKE